VISTLKKERLDAQGPVIADPQQDLSIQLESVDPRWN
jgi:hypothetical protein